MRVAALTTYPVKGCAGVAVASTEVGPTGLAHDRTFVVVAPDGAARTQRRSPLLATVRPWLDDDGLGLSAPGAGPATVPWGRSGSEVPVSVLGVAGHRGVDQGDEVAAWLTSLLGVPSRLAGVAPDHDRRFDGVHPSRAGWADSGAVTLLTRSAVHGLSDRVVADGGEPLGADRFRMNIVLTGAEEHAEDDLHRVRLGSVLLGFQKRAVRCAVTTVDQDRGERDGPEPLRTLASYRRDADDGVVFGAKFAVLEPGSVAVGDGVR